MALNSYKILDTLYHSRRFLLYKAERVSDGMKVLIKTQDPAQITDKALYGSLRAEAAAAMKLDHPAIRRGLGCFEEGLSVYLVAEYAEGESLAERILQHPPKLEQSLIWARDILNSLIHAAQLNEIHGNLNPYNIIVGYDASLKLIGFGKNRAAWKHSEGNFKYQLPMLYVAPEIFNTTKAHPNSDLYSWAVIVYQTICGQMPWRLDSFSSPEEQKHQSFSRAIIMPDSSVMPDWLYSILLSCFKIDPYERPANALELLELLKSESADFDWGSVPETEKLSTEPELIEPSPLEEPVAEPEPIEELLAESAEPAVEDEIEPEITVEPEPELSISPIPHHEPDSELIAKILADAERVVEIKSEPASEETVEPEFSFIEEVTEPIFDIIDEPRKKTFEPSQEQPEPEPEPIPEEAGKPLAVAPAPEPKPEAEKPKIAELPAQPIASTSPKAAQAPRAKPVYNVPEPERKDLSGMQKSFRVLMALSLLIVAYIAVQHFLLKERPDFSIPEPEIDTEAILQPELTENMPIEMVLVPADTLVMGSIHPEAKDDEFPLLTVPLRSFMISATEITQKEWSMVFAANPSLFRGEYFPVENVSFYDVIEYCNAKSLKDGLTPAYDYYGTEIICDFDANGYRLPTEAEWELAAKAGVGNSFLRFSGSDKPDEVAWFAENSNARTHPVGSKKPNAIGIHDMSGNIYEWVWNWYTPYSHRISNLYSGPESGTDKVIRGGSWYHNEALMRNTARNYAKPFVKNGYIGFRVVRSR
jgi:formylglycine-generating enzyme required for sulfatase activity/serine/threonine protein kinase